MLMGCAVLWEHYVAGSNPVAPIGITKIANIARGKNVGKKMAYNGFERTKLFYN